MGQPIDLFDGHLIDFVIHLPEHDTSIIPRRSLFAYIEARHVNTSADDDVDEFIARVVIAEENLRVENFILVQNEVNHFLRALRHRHGTGDIDTAGLLRLRKENRMNHVLLQSSRKLVP